MLDLLFLFKTQMPPRLVYFWVDYRVPRKQCWLAEIRTSHIHLELQRQGSVSIAACSPSHRARLLPSVNQLFPIDSNPLFPNRFTRKTTSTPLPTSPRCTAWHGTCCWSGAGEVVLWSPQSHDGFVQHWWTPGDLHTFTPGKRLAHSSNSDILSLTLYKQKSSVSA